MKNNPTKNLIKFLPFFSIILILALNIFFPLSTYASTEKQLAEMEARKDQTIQSNEFTNWPVGPVLGAEGAILIEANSNTVLYSKNCDERLYPASTTKILTAILIMENCELDETITFSKNAIESISWNDSNMGASIGDQITVEQALYAILVGSANEAAYAMAEHISGDISSFSDLMNKKAEELGCVNSHFSNPNGLHSDDHYTTAYDLSLIAKEFFTYDFLCTLSSTYSYEITSTDPSQEATLLYTKNKLLLNREYEYPALVGAKTGYTDLARQTLVSCAQKDGLSLICVILKEEAPYQFEDTVTLFNYGFSNFINTSIAENETNYQFSFSEPFQCNYSLFGNSTPLVSYDQKNYVTTPISVPFDILTSEINLGFDPNLTYSPNSSKILAHINYYYYSSPVGFLPIHIEESLPQITSPADSFFVKDDNPFSNNSKIYYIQLKTILTGIIIIFLPIIFFSYLKTLFFSGTNSKSRNKHNRKRKSSSPYKSYKF